MMWIVTASGYAAAYAAMVVLLAARPDVRLWAADLGLLFSPLLPLAVVVRRRRDWNGRALIYWSALAVGCGLWVLGHLAWSSAELLRHQQVPWLDWPVALKLTGGVLPILALVAWPHANIRGGSLATIVLDIAGLTLVSAFLFWSLIVAPGLTPSGSPIGMRSLVAVGAFFHTVLVIGFASAAFAAGYGRWRTTYARLAAGAALGSVLLLANAAPMAAGTYTTGAFGDLGWIVPFWFYAWAASEAPSSPAATASPVEGWARAPHLSPLLLAAAAVPIVGYGPRLFAPLDLPIENYRGIVTAATLTVALGLTIVRVAVEQRARHRSDYRLWLLATACEQSDDLIVVIRGDGIEYANEAFRRSFGYSLPELQSIDPRTLLSASSLPMLEEFVATLRRGDVARRTLRLCRRDGTTFEAACSVVPIVSASGRTPYFVGVVHDLTEQLELRDRIVRHERMSAICELVSGVAHEVNNPLQAVTGLADVLLHGDLDPDVRADLEQIRRQAGRAGLIVRNLLLFTRRSAEDRHPADINNLVRTVVAMRGYELARQGVRLNEHYEPTLPQILVNGDEMQQAIWHVIVNAEDAMTRANPGGVLSVRTFADAAATQVVLEIADDGPGVPASVGHRVFEPFFTTKPVGEGPGLGLSIAFGIVAAHGGSLELAPADRGARFRITLPADRGEPALTFDDPSLL